MQKFPFHQELHGSEDNLLLLQPNNSNYLTMDSQERFEHNLKRQPADWLYRSKQVNYTWNSNGYRCPEWKDIDWSDSIVALGCSLIVGEGLDDADIITTQMAKELSAPVINLGIPAGSLDALHYNSLRLIDAGIRPKAVCLLAPVLTRATYFSIPCKNLGPWVLDKRDIYADFYKNFIAIPPNAEIHGYMTLRGIESAWQSVGVPIHIWDYEDLAMDIDKARDLAHPGIETVKLWAHSMVSQLKPS